MSDDTEKWYQAKLQFRDSENFANVERFRVGPPRKLIADVLLDLIRSSEARKRQVLEEARGRLKFWDEGAEILWPDTTERWVSRHALERLSRSASR